MAEGKRVPFQSVEITSESTNKTKKDKQIAPSFRFELTLPESNEENYPSFNYAKLLKNAEKKRRKDKKKDNNNVLSGLNPLDEDDDKVLDIARYFETKYGNRKKVDGVDLGAGYDENDSFIDNTDAYDEHVPESLTTRFGGFYVNSGPLEFENAPGDRNNVNDKDNGNDDDDDDDDEEEEDDDDEMSEEDSTDTASKKVIKRCISSSDNDETENTMQPPKSKPCLEETGNKIPD